MIASTTKSVKLQASLLKVHPSAQRELLPLKISRLEKSMDLNALGSFHAVEYPIKGINGLWVIDGQHRLEALITLGMGDWMIDVLIHQNIKTDAQASALFLRLNDRAIVTIFDRYINEVQSNDPVSIGITTILQHHGLRIGRYRGLHVIPAIACCKRAYQFDKGVSMDIALSIAKKAWDFGGGSTEGIIIEGLSFFVWQHQSNHFNAGNMANKLSRFLPVQIIAQATARTRSFKKSMRSQICEDLLHIYNTNKKNKIGKNQNADAN